MGVTEKLWDALTTVIKMNDKIERLAGTVVTQQQKIEQLTERVIRLETALKSPWSHAAARGASSTKPVSEGCATASPPGTDAERAEARCRRPRPDRPAR